MDYQEKEYVNETLIAKVLGIKYDAQKLKATMLLNIKQGREGYVCFML